MKNFKFLKFSNRESGVSFSGNVVVAFITFYTGDTALGTGFVLTFGTRNVGNPNPERNYGHSTITHDTGEISWPGNGDSYKPNELSTWIITSGHFNAQINVTAVDIQGDSGVQCRFDSLIIYSLRIGSSVGYFPDNP